MRSKLINLKFRNLGCIGPDWLSVNLDSIVCLVGRNNTGKSTVLRAYELAQNSLAITEDDLCHWCPDGEHAEVELLVHIPDGIANVDSKWKMQDGDLKIVKSRWQWKVVGEKPIRQTWDPEADDGDGAWAEDGKAGGADNVFNSRLPQPLRIDSLGDAFKEHDELLKLVTEPVAKDLKALQNDPSSNLFKAIERVVAEAGNPVASYQSDIDRIAKNLETQFAGVFPDLGILLNVAMERPSIDPAKLLISGSTVRIKESDSETDLKLQGTGSRRALFWSLLQVRNEIVLERKASAERAKQQEKLTKSIEKEQKKKTPDQTKITALKDELKVLQEGGGETNDVALPGHILLIDEPENALHPTAVRAARDHLYKLANDDDWQVMLTTHSPYFINPLEDQTTIVRLERSAKFTTPFTFRTSTAQFSTDDKENLRALLQLDSALSEMFFGSYPIVVEGDTELAAFVSTIIEDDSSSLLEGKVALVPARGKASIEPIVRLIAHFRIPFGVLHDSDSPRRKDGKTKDAWVTNGAWTTNRNLSAAIAKARENGIEVRHRVNLPDFERFLGGIEETKDKPIHAYRLLKSDPNLRKKVQELFQDLFESPQHDPFDDEFTRKAGGSVDSALEEAVKEWASKNAEDDPRFTFQQAKKVSN